MALDVFLNFPGTCRDAVTFYAKVFKTEAPQFMTFGSAPPMPGETVDEKDKNLIMYTTLPIFGTNMMFSDVPSGMPLVMGSNISLTLSTKDKEEIKRLYAALSDGGEVGMELQSTFWSDLYGMVTDKFGVNWQLSHDSGKTW